MITIVVPTRNRAHTLKLVASSYLGQEAVTEVIFVDDCGDDDTANVIAGLAVGYPDVNVIVHRQAARSGASQARNVGAALARNRYVLFCDDDEYMEPGYAKTCLNKLEELGASAVSGRRIYMQDGESQGQATLRFGDGLRRSRPFNYVICEYVNGAIFKGDKKLPFTNANILTLRQLVLDYPFDPFYATGNGYREESDFQMNLFVHGHDIAVTNDCHTLHLPLSQVKSGGQRVSRWRRIWWSIYYTRYFFAKYYPAYAKRVGLRTPQTIALALFSGFVVYKETVRPVLHAFAMFFVKRARGPGSFRLSRPSPTDG